MLVRISTQELESFFAIVVLDLILEMTLTLFNSIFHRLTSRWPSPPPLLYAAAWTAVLTVIVAVASFWSEAAFVSAISRKSVFSRACEWEGLVRVPMAPLVFAAVVVGSSALVVRALGLWEVDDDDETH
ncbi:hypothetical protein CsSME_00017232 [Camellia sinensis var. sinensis]|uniref:Uncharacterized protein n=1 Tax=Camellia sinensis var. sinensis TaxID=542762 RepID=A0A4S4DTD1_CAMSN|nr:uncharacterized protein LOC114287387 [Camellia sinensis]THG06501.1 hypothetical protein TEA_017665 [Camellia sinensis var. sinensis]